MILCNQRKCQSPTLTWDVIVKSPRISPVITLALVLLDASAFPDGKIASPVYSLPSVEMKRTKRCALTARGRSRSNGENHISQFSGCYDFSIPCYIPRRVISATPQRTTQTCGSIPQSIPAGAKHSLVRVLVLELRASCYTTSLRVIRGSPVN